MGSRWQLLRQPLGGLLPLVAPLLLELARARRARQFLAPDHSTFRDALDRATRLWRSTLSGVGALTLGVGEHGFSLPGGTPVRGPGIEELARDLLERGIAGFRVEPGIEAEAFEPLVEVLAGPPDASAAADLARGTEGGTLQLRPVAAPAAVEAAAAEPALAPEEPRVAPGPSPAEAASTPA